MHAVFLLRAFFTGFCAAAVFGPVSIMTFNRAALHGVYLGVATALGAALTDGFLFFLSLLGALGSFTVNNTALFMLDIVGACVLFGLGFYYWRTVLEVQERVTSVSAIHLLGVAVKTFLVTLLNPSAILFFVFIRVKLFGNILGPVPFGGAVLGGLAVAGGTFCALSLVSMIAAFVGARLSPAVLRRISQATALVLTGLGAFLACDAFSLIVQGL